MKICSICKIEKDFQEFHKNSSKKSGYQSYCKACRQNHSKNLYANDVNNIRNRLRVIKKRTRDNNRIFIQKYKRFCGCKLCGFKVPVALDFHHLDPTEKDKNVGDLMSFSTQKLKEEIRKCVVLCANCHRMVHAGLLEIV